MYVNIRSINANLKNLEIIIESLHVKPCIIICTYTRKLGNYKQYQLPNYKIFYNNSKINQNDGVVLYINSEIFEYTETIVINRVSFLCSKIRLDNKDELIISAVYRCHDIPKTEFIWSIKKYIMNYINSKNHCLIRDFNINIMSKSLDSAHDTTLTQDFLNHLLEYDRVYPMFSWNHATRPIKYLRRFMYRYYVPKN